MTLRQLECHQHQRAQSDPARDPEIAVGNRVLSFTEWCLLNSISPATGRRIIKSGKGPIVTQLSPRRIGVTVTNNAAWQRSRERDGSVTA
jgi:hypothetical protein